MSWQARRAEAGRCSTPRTDRRPGPRSRSARPRHAALRARGARRGEPGGWTRRAGRRPAGARAARRPHRRHASTAPGGLWARSRTCTPRAARGPRAGAWRPPPRAWAEDRHPHHRGRRTIRHGRCRNRCLPGRPCRPDRRRRRMRREPAARGSSPRPCTGTAGRAATVSAPPTVPFAPETVLVVEPPDVTPLTVSRTAEVCCGIVSHHRLHRPRIHRTSTRRRPDGAFTVGVLTVGVVTVGVLRWSRDRGGRDRWGLDRGGRSDGRAGNRHGRAGHRRGRHRRRDRRILPDPRARARSRRRRPSPRSWPAT